MTSTTWFMPATPATSTKGITGSRGPLSASCTQDDYAEHFATEGDGALRALSETGAFHIARLQLNRPELIAHRLRQQRNRALRAEVTDLLHIVDRQEQRIQDLAAEIMRLQQRD